MGGNVFQILEIEPTNDKKEIKKAYAKLVKRYHPEEYPEEWKKIHDAYEHALKIAQYVQPEMAEPPVQAVQPEASEPTGGLPKKKPPVLEKSRKRAENGKNRKKRNRLTIRTKKQ